MKKWLILAALAFTFAPSTARADWLVTPNVGSLFGGPAADDDWNTSYGVSLGWMGEGILGWEADFSFGGSDFFERDVFNLDPDFIDANVGSFMGNVLVGVPVGGTTGAGVRPYFVGGIGLVTHSVQTDDALFDFDETSSNFGIDVGGGVMGFATDTIGFRGDLRYYRGFTDVNELRDEFNIDLDLVDDIDFWRATGGVTFRW